MLSCNFVLLVMHAFMSNLGGYGLAKKKKKFNAIAQNHREQGFYMKGKYFGPFP